TRCQEVADADHQMEGGPTMANQVESTPTTPAQDTDAMRAALARMRALKPERWEYAALVGWVAGKNPELVEDALDAMEARRAEREMEAA
ncbi:MAG TPA: hypothetical protein VFU47_09535, partial [Armatimonadota bacterium]|nr:hypothetical protein [Armatimonadota bacterium]